MFKSILKCSHNLGIFLHGFQNDVWRKNKHTASNWKPTANIGYLQRIQVNMGDLPIVIILNGSRLLIWDNHLLFTHGILLCTSSPDFKSHLRTSSTYPGFSGTIWALDVIYPGECSMCTWKESLFCCFWMECSINIILFYFI